MDQGIEEMRRQLSASRKLVEDAAEKMRTSFSRPNSAKPASSEGTLEVSSEVMANAAILSLGRFRCCNKALFLTLKLLSCLYLPSVAGS